MTSYSSIKTPGVLIFYLYIVYQGFADNGEYWRSGYEDDQFEAEIGRLWQEVKPLYQQLHAYVKNVLLKTYKDKAEKFPSTGQIPGHLLGNL